MPTINIIYFSIGVGFFAVLFLLYFGYRLLNAFSIATWFVVLLLLVFDRWLWRRFSMPKILKTPLLYGTWKGSYTSNYEHQDTGKKASGDIYLVVKQNFWSVHVLSFSAESTSSSITANIRKLENGTNELVYAYSNRPQVTFRDRSKPNLGTALVDLGSKAYPEQLQGEYFTDRGHQGDLIFEKHKTKIVDNYEEAEKLFQ